MKKMQWPVTIEEVDNGYQVQVGCKRLVFESKEKMFVELMAYVNGERTDLSEQIKKEMANDGCQPTVNSAPPQEVY